jgi:hypothetical protein
VSVIAVPFADDHVVICGGLVFAGFVFGNWRWKDKSQVLLSLPGKKAEEY